MNERLRASRERWEHEQHDAGKAAGEKWAAEHAEYGDLHSLSVEFGSSESITAHEVANTLQRGPEEVFGDGFDRLTESFIVGFVEGAVELMDAVL